MQQKLKKKRKKPKCPSTDEGINYIHTMEFYSARKRTIDTHHNMDESQNNYDERSQTKNQEYIL